MKTLLIFVLVSLIATFSFAVAQAAHQIFLPIVATGNFDFKVDRLRLWHVTENNGNNWEQNPIVCGSEHLMQVDVVAADSAPLVGMTLEIQHEDEGKISTEQVKTDAAGVAKIAIADQATVQLVKDAQGHDITSQPATVTTITAEIPTDRLQTSGYCTDAASCQAFVASQGCQGYFSWGVVLQKNQRD